MIFIHGWDQGIFWSPHSWSTRTYCCRWYKSCRRVLWRNNTLSINSRHVRSMFGMSQLIQQVFPSSNLHIHFISCQSKYLPSKHKNVLVNRICPPNIRVSISFISRNTPKACIKSREMETKSLFKLAARGKSPPVNSSWLAFSTHSKIYQPDAVRTGNKARFGLDLSAFQLIQWTFVYPSPPHQKRKKKKRILKQTKPLEYLLKLSAPHNHVGNGSVFVFVQTLEALF